MIMRDYKLVDQVVAIDLRQKSIRVIASSSTSPLGDGPFCFDQTLGLLSLGSNLAPLIAYDTLSNRTTILLKDISGMPSVFAKGIFACAQGMVILTVITPQFTNRLIAWNFPASAVAFHNTTVLGIHEMHFADVDSINI